MLVDLAQVAVGHLGRQALDAHITVRYLIVTDAPGLLHVRRDDLVDVGAFVHAELVAGQLELVEALQSALALSCIGKDHLSGLRRRDGIDASALEAVLDRDEVFEQLAREDGSADVVDEGDAVGLELRLELQLVASVVA